jgi:hypothetical protein
MQFKNSVKILLSDLMDFKKIELQYLWEGYKIPIWDLWAVFGEEYQKSNYTAFYLFLKTLDLGIEMKYEFPNGDPSNTLETYHVVNPEKYMLARIKYGF